MKIKIIAQSLVLQISLLVFLNPSCFALTDEEAWILANPTTDIETYEATRKEVVSRSKLPNWSFNILIAPFAFRDTDFRARRPDATTAEFHHPNTRVGGFLMSFEKILFRRAKVGLFSLGGEAGIYTAKQDSLFDQVFPAMFSLAPFVQWQAVFFNNQIVVPFVRAEYAGVRYDYKFNKQAVKGIKQVPRGDIGILFFLNSLEPSSSVDLENNYGIKRTYLSAAYSVAKDTSEKDFDLTEQSFRFGLRLEY